MISKKSIYIMVCIAATLVVSFSFIKLHKSSSQQEHASELPVLSTVVAESSGVKVFHDFRIYNDIEQLTAAADVVVIGKVTEKGGSRNLAKNPENTEQEDLTTKVMSQEYKFTVEKWVKGKGEKQIDIVYPDYMVSDSGAQLEEGNEPLDLGDRYVLFLSNGVKGTYYGVAEPWQIKLTNGSIQVKSKVKEIQVNNFEAYSEKELVEKLEKIKK